MNESSAILFGALIGAGAGFIGGAIAALAAVRSGQLAARVPLGAKIFEVNRTFVVLSASANTPQFTEALKSFSSAWNGLAVHQKILAPSRRIGALNDLVWHATTSDQLPRNVLVALVGDAMNAATEMIAAQSRHLFRWRASIEEWSIGRRFRAKTVPALTSDRLKFIAKHI